MSFAVSPLTGESRKESVTSDAAEFVKEETIKSDVYFASPL